MNPFPAEHELIAFFECEPELLDNTRGIPWFYNRLTFDSTCGEDRFRFVLEPADEVLQLRWERGGVEVVELDLNWVSGLEVEMRRA